MMLPRVGDEQTGGGMKVEMEVMVVMEIGDVDMIRVRKNTQLIKKESRNRYTT